MAFRRIKSWKSVNFRMRRDSGAFTFCGARFEPLFGEVIQLRLEPSVGRKVKQASPRLRDRLPRRTRAQDGAASPPKGSFIPYNMPVYPVARLSLSLPAVLRNEGQTMYLGRGPNGWKIARADSVERQTLVRYGTPVYQAPTSY